ncbi:hypothetical protein EYF80_010724 [Liparis tanakae]|uniref:Uncharacterized protein n=1 Tax=Liparis tanakae TaxID=230148 RepID=A0A4Z2IMG0_9TELE|nr:hypothetical protein EYF80_010724 [Liparis tanakae]
MARTSLVFVEQTDGPANARGLNNGLVKIFKVDTCDTARSLFSPTGSYYDSIYTYDSHRH